MAIVRSTTFSGSSPYSVDPGAATLSSIVQNAQADVAGVFAHITDDTVGTHIDHSGGVRGCRLGVPMVNQYLSRGLALVSGAKLNGGTDSAAQVQFPFLVYVGPGETFVQVDVVAENLDEGLNDDVPPQIFARLSSTANFATAAGLRLETLMSTRDGGSQRRYFAIFGGVNTPGLYLLTISTEARFIADFVRVVDVMVRPGRGAGVVVSPQPGDATNPTPVAAPGASEALFHQPMDEAIFVDGLTGWHTSRLDRNINGALEYLTGAPAGSNANYTHTESGLENPTRDRFSAMTRKTFADEPIAKIPVLACNFGGIKSNGGYLVDPAVPAEVLARQSYGPYAPSATLIDLGVQTMRMPDVPSGLLRVAVVLGQNTGVGWTNIRVRPQIGSLTPPAVVTPTAVTGATHLGFATFSGLATNRDSVDNRLRIGVQQVAGGFAATNYCLLAAAAWIEE